VLGGSLGALGTGDLAPDAEMRRRSDIDMKIPAAEIPAEWIWIKF